VSTDDQNLVLFDDESEQDDPATVQLEPRSPRPHAWHLRTRWVVLAFVALVVVGLTVGIIVFNASAPDAARGARTARSAAQQYVAAVNAGSRAGAAKISCSSFSNDAEAAAASGKDPGIRFSLDLVTSLDKNQAIITVTEHLKFSGGTKQTDTSRLLVTRGAGLWLVCGHSS
jgi:hypothetical protein